MKRKRQIIEIKKEKNEFFSFFDWKIHFYFLYNRGDFNRPFFKNLSKNVRDGDGVNLIENQGKQKKNKEK